MTIFRFTDTQRITLICLDCFGEFQHDCGSEGITFLSRHSARALDAGANYKYLECPHCDDLLCEHTCVDRVTLCTATYAAPNSRVAFCCRPVLHSGNHVNDRGPIKLEWKNIAWCASHHFDMADGWSGRCSLVVKHDGPHKNHRSGRKWE